MKATYDQLKEALIVAVDIIMYSEPKHSCAVSDIAVALAAVSCDLVDDKVLKVIKEHVSK